MVGGIKMGYLCRCGSGEFGSIFIKGGVFGGKPCEGNFSLDLRKL